MSLAPNLIHLGPRPVAGNRVAPILRALGVPIKKGASFWVANAHELHYIFADFEGAARARKREMHPDLGGDHDRFVELSVACDFVRRSFARRGIGDLPSAAQREREKEAREARARLGPARENIPATPESIRRERLDRRARQARARRWRDIDAFRGRQRARYHRNKAAGKTEDPEYRRAITARYQERHPDRVNLSQRKYRRKNLNKVRAWRANYRASAARRGVTIKGGGEGNRIVPGTPQHRRRLASRRKLSARRRAQRAAQISP